MILPEVIVYAKRVAAMFIGGSSSFHNMVGLSDCDTTGPIFAGAE
jgi:hypothetical protein